MAGGCGYTRTFGILVVAEVENDECDNQACTKRIKKEERKRKKKKEKMTKTKKRMGGRVAYRLHERECTPFQCRGD